MARRAVTVRKETRGGATARARGERTRDELMAEASKLGVSGRSRMNKQQLTRAIAGKKAAQARRKRR